MNELAENIYKKYIYNKEINNVKSDIDNSNTKEELEELVNIITSLYYEGEITPEEYTELMDKIEEKKNGIL